MYKIYLRLFSEILKLTSATKTLNALFFGTMLSETMSKISPK